MMEELQKELETLRGTLRLYEEPPDLDEQKQNIVVDGFKSVKTNYIGSLHIRYQITRTRLSHKSEKFIVYRRFSDWLDLYSLLCDSLKGKLIPVPPPKKSLGNTDHDFVELRMIQLHAYTKALASHPDIRRNDYFRKFLYLPNEQWEELTGTVTAVTTLPEDEHGREAEVRNSTSQSSSMSKMFKTLGKTGKSLLSGLSIGENADYQNSLILNDDVSELNLNKEEVSFVESCKRLTIVSVDKAILHSFGASPVQTSSKDHFLIPGNSASESGNIDILRSKLYQKATDSIVKLIKLAKKTSTCDIDLSDSVQKLALQEGTSGETMFNNLIGFSEALQAAGKAEMICCRSMSEKHGDKNEVIQSLYQIMFLLQGSQRFYKRFKKDKAMGVQNISDRQEEVSNCEAYVNSLMATPLESFAQQQIDRAAANVKIYKKLYAELCEAS